MSVILENGVDPFDGDAERTLIRHGAEGANTASASAAQISLRSGRGVRQRWIWPQAFSGSRWVT